jgi:serine acetyltransferase
VNRLQRGLQQLGYLVHETRSMTGKNKPWRWASVWFTESFWVVASYRLSRSAYLMLGRGWPVVRVFCSPLLFATRPWFVTTEIHYTADLGKGFRVLHPSLGAVVSGYTVAGENLTLVGGNCIGLRKKGTYGDIQLGDNVMVGVNAVVLGPVRVGDRVKIGASALVIRDVEDDHVVHAPTPAAPRPKRLNG